MLYPSSRSPANKLFFPPGGHTHDRHVIPPDRLHISLSDPILVAAEQYLSDGVQKDGAAPKLEYPLFEFSDGIFSQLSSALSDMVDPLSIIQATDPEPGFQEIADHASLNPLESCDISEVVVIPTVINGSSPRDPDLHCTQAAAENSRRIPHLAPLASETFKQELYMRGYLKRPASRPSNDVPRKSRIGLLFHTRKVFPKVLGRRQGRKVAECLKAEQDAAKVDVHLSQDQPSSPSVGLVTLRTPHAQGIDSPTNTSASASASDPFDLHEFSYITAFTTPPSSPSIVLDRERFKKGADLGDSKHAV